MRLYFRSGLEISRYNIYSDKILKDTRLAVIADLHNCMCEDGGRQLFNVIESQKPDIILIAGDLVDGSCVSEGTMQLLERLAGSFKVIYGMGNHERKLIFGSHRKSSRSVRLFRETLKKTGVRLLSNKSRIIEDSGIRVTCLDLPLSYFPRMGHRPLGYRKMTELIGEPDTSYYNILIAHDPLHFKSYSDYGSELIVSGHLHGGVIRLPGLGGLISPELKLFPKYDAGEYRRKGSRMLVTKGLGMHTIHVRINNPTELMIVDLHSSLQDGR